MAAFKASRFVCMFALPLLISCSFTQSSRACTQQKNHRPIIGVLCQETVTGLSALGPSYIAAWCVKFLESSGSRVVPIRVGLSKSEYTDVFYSINGLFILGGDVDLVTSAYAKAAKILFDLVMQNLLRITCTQDVALPLNLTKESKQSKLFRNFPKGVLDTLASESMTGNMHNWSLSLKNFSANEKLRNFYRVLTTNTDSSGVEFISTMEAYHYPVYALQWHPEMNPYEWANQRALVHSDGAIRAAFHMAAFLVSEGEPPHVDRRERRFTWSKCFTRWCRVNCKNAISLYV
ncbi:gamma-glutamyl hydrolase-like [Lethenteron reissneri]|uniref:gamma-glutamyl hydrolase-like n=1 Tax=Lethenteron reissneri TaxID=7753 RepID=UPI002AB74075|nr:gamma-glutamyl hydrolase-like [Lethenteron reissneri]